MKKMITTSLVLFAYLIAQGQENKPDTTRLNMGETQVLIIKTPKGTVIVDENTEPTDTVDVEDGTEEDSHDGHWAGVDFGVNMLMNSQFKTSFPENPEWQNDPAKSYYWNFNFIDRRFNIYKEYIGITTGLGFNFTQVGLKNNYILNENSDSLWVVKDTVSNYSKNKLRATYLQIPLLLEFNTNSDADKSFYLATGLIGGVRIASNVKRKSEVNGIENTEKIKGTYGLNPFKLDATVRMGYSNWGFFANYSLLPLLDTHKTVEVYPLTLGLSLNF